METDKLGYWRSLCEYTDYDVTVNVRERKHTNTTLDYCKCISLGLSQ